MTGRYRFRAVLAEDLHLLNAWRRQPHVRAWWGDPDLEDADDFSDPRVAAMIVECDGKPLGFMQDYDVHGWAGHHFGYLPAGSRGVDQFIGEPGLTGLGHGTAFIRQRMGALFAAGAPAIGTDPHPANARAIAACLKAGFRIAGPEEDTEWGRVVRMEVWRAQVPHNGKRRPRGTAVSHLPGRSSGCAADEDRIDLLGGPGFVHA